MEQTHPPSPGEGFVIPPPPAQTGYEWRVIPYDWWRAIDPEAPARPCRKQGKAHVACGKTAVAELSRSQRSRRPGRTTSVWWPYCEQDMQEYGIYLVDGKLMAWVRQGL